MNLLGKMPGAKHCKQMAAGNLQRRQNTDNSQRNTYIQLQIINIIGRLSTLSGINAKGNVLSLWKNADSSNCAKKKRRKK